MSSGSLRAATPGPYRPSDLALPPGFIIETLVSGLDLPTTAAWSADGRLFIAQKGGRVRVFYNGALQPRDFIDLSAEVNAYWDRGLIGLAVHPDFPASPYLYLLHTYDPPGVTRDGNGARVSRLIRVTANPDDLNVALPGSAVVLLGTNSVRANLGNEHSPDDVQHPSCASAGLAVQDCLPSDSAYHSVGDLAFAPDGALFVSNGEAGAWEYVDPRSMRALDLDSLAGKVLRIDPDTGQGLPDNPFFTGDPASNRSKVWSYGLRNPFRLSMAPGDAQPFVGEVGNNAWEEINYGRGQNYGWPCYEGPGRFARFENDSTFGPVCMELYTLGTMDTAFPRFAYPHNGGYGAIVLGDVYVGSSYPAGYRNTLFYGDYSRNFVQYVTFGASGEMTAHPFAQGNPIVLGGIVDVSVGPDTNLHLIVLDATSPTAGRVERIRYIGGGNAPPVARISSLPSNGGVPLSVRFDGQGSRDPEAQQLAFLWELGDGATSMLPSFTYAYEVTGTYPVTLTVTDPQGAWQRDTVVISAGNHRPSVSITSPDDAYRYSVGDVIAFTSVVSDVEDGDVAPAGISWRALLHHGDHVHPDFAFGAGPSGSLAAVDHGDDTWVELCVTAVDSGRLSNSACHALLPRLTRQEFVSDPAGLRLLYNGEWRTAPFVVFVPANAGRTLAAPADQLGCPFRGWDDGGPASRTIAIGTTPMTYTARYDRCAVRLPIVARVSDVDPVGPTPVPPGPPPGVTPLPPTPPGPPPGATPAAGG
jgi:glucose/arabinose dehydrogenase